MVVLLSSWKQKVRRYRRYRMCLCAALVLCCAVLTGYVYYRMDSNIPSIIRVRAGKEETFRLGVPAKAEIVSAGSRTKSNIPEGAVTIDLSRTVTMKAEEMEAYLMDVRLFGFLPFKQVDIQVIEAQEVIPVGIPIGIYMKADGIMVIGTGEFVGRDGANHSPAKYILHSGDYVKKLNGECVEDKDTFIAKIEQCGGAEQLITVERGKEIMDVKVKPVQDKSGAWRIGAWVRDNTQGVGTMTYIDADGDFGALGHGINDVDTSELMDMYDGTLYQTDIVAIHRGSVGKPGEMVGMITYSDDRILGDITLNCKRGIFGHCNNKALQMTHAEPMPVGLKQEIKKGAAQILCTVDGTTRYYDIEITDIHLDHDNINRGLEIKVTDKELLQITGGIVQGMSGAPIVQDGKLVGAVTHVLVQDSSRGYGIFIENMLEH